MLKIEVSVHHLLLTMLVFRSVCEALGSQVLKINLSQTINDLQYLTSYNGYFNNSQLKEGFIIELEEALEHERQKTADRMEYLESKYSQLVDQLSGLQPVLSQFVESYLLLQKEVKHFPKMINKTVATVTKQV